MKKKWILICIIFIVFSCRQGKRNLSKITAKTIPIDSTINSKQNIKAVIAPYKQKMTKQINTVISYAPKDLVRTDGIMQSSLGNLLSDLCYTIANPIFKEKTKKKIDFSMFNYGGIRTAIFKGNVTIKNAFELMPFENKLVVVKISGKKIVELVHYFIKNKKAHPLSKQIQLKYSTPDNYSLKINGKSFNKNQSYFVLTTDYLQSGGDQMNFFSNPISLTKLNIKMRNAVITYFKRVDTLKAQLDHRVIIIK